MIYERGYVAYNIEYQERALMPGEAAAPYKAECHVFNQALILNYWKLDFIFLQEANNIY